MSNNAAALHLSKRTAALLGGFGNGWQDAAAALRELGLPTGARQARELVAKGLVESRGTGRFGEPRREFRLTKAGRLAKRLLAELEVES